MSCSVLRVRFARGDMHMLLGVVWLVWCGILSALYLGERGAGSMLEHDAAGRTTPRLVDGTRAQGGPPCSEMWYYEAEMWSCEACPPPSTWRGERLWHRPQPASSNTSRGRKGEGRK